jgi:hypothetical protein
MPILKDGMKMRKKSQPNIRKNSVAPACVKMHINAIKASAPLLVSVIRGLFFCPSTATVFTGAFS